MRNFLAELRERNVFKVAVVYAIAGWMTVQVASVMFPALALQPWTVTLVAALVIVGFPIALVLAWALELTPEGLRRVDRPAVQDAVVLQAAPAVPDAAASSILPVPPAATGSEGPGQEAKSIAVLPFADMSPAHDNEYFSSGLTEELLNVLSRVPGLRVASRTSCFAFKGKDADIHAVAERLKVSHVVEGGVRKAGERIRITAQLIETRTDTRLWSETWDRDMGDIFAIQEEIASRIVEGLALQLRPGDASGVATRNPRAYDLYLKGLNFYRRFGPRSQGFAIEMFERATVVDPSFASAWAGLAGAHAVVAVFHNGGEAALSAADEASRRAVELAPKLAEAHSARAVYLSARERFEEAAAEFEQAIELNPSLFEAWYQYARTALHQGDLQRALELFERAAEVDPEDFEGPLIAAPIYRSLGQEHAALAAQRRGLALVERHLEEHPDNARAYLLGCSALYDTGRREEALTWLERAIAIDPSDPSTRYNAACFYAQIGEIDTALDFLENTNTSRSWAENDPELEPLRQHPRFRELMNRLEG